MLDSSAAGEKATPSNVIVGSSVRHVQKEIIKEMLGLEPGSTLIWKVLVYDDQGRQIISPLLKLSELKELGVTIHLYQAILFLGIFIQKDNASVTFLQYT